jgi:radical SAM superfamily enzyme YgiQ (UPF0313 family)
MKILLVMPHPYPKRGLFSRFTYPSLTLKQLAAITPHEHSVELVDERFERIDFKKNYDVVGISCLTYNSLRGYEIADEFRKRGVKVVFGGYHASLLPEEAKQHADSVVIGEGELTWPRVLEDIKKGQLKPFYKADKPVEPEDIPAARHDIGTYTPFSEAIQASRGCPTGCEFCAMQIVEGPRFRGRPVDHVVEEMKSIKTKLIFFADASLTINPKYSKSLFKAMKELNKYSECFGNINVLTRDDEFLKLASEAGVINWYVGIESISQENIDAAGKSTNKVENYAKAIKKIKDYGMMATGFFMFGFDFDTVETFDKTLQAIYEWGLDEVSFSIVTPYPGTRLFERYDREGKIICRDWSRYAEGNVNYKLENLTEEELMNGIKKMAMDYYSIPNIIKRSFSNNNYSLYRLLIKLVRNFSVRSFYLHEKLGMN